METHLHSPMAVAFAWASKHHQSLCRSYTYFSPFHGSWIDWDRLYRWFCWWFRCFNKALIYIGYIYIGYIRYIGPDVYSVYIQNTNPPSDFVASNPARFDALFWCCLGWAELSQWWIFLLGHIRWRGNKMGKFLREQFEGWGVWYIKSSSKKPTQNKDMYWREQGKKLTLQVYCIK